MSNAKRVLKNLFSLSVAEVANKGIQLVIIMILGRVIMTEGLGVVGVAQGFFVYFFLFSTLGFNIVGAREIAKYPERIREYVNSILTIRVLLSVLMYLILIFIVSSIDKPEIEKTAILIYGLNLFFNAILVDWVYQGTEKMEVLAIRQVATSLLNLLGILLLVNNQADSVVAVGVMTASIGINSLWLLILYFKWHGPIKPSFDFPLWKEMLKSSIPLTFFSFFIIIINNLNILMLSFMKGQAETGLYYAATKILLVTLVPTAIIQLAFLPLLSRSETLEDRQKIMKKYSQLIILMAMITAGVVFTFADYFIVLVVGSDFAEAGPLLKILMFSSVIVFINTMYSTPLIAWKIEKVLVWAMGIAGVVNIAANSILIPAYGASGAAIGSVMSEFTVCVGLAYFFRKHVKKLYIAQIWKYGLMAAASCLIGYYLNQYGLHEIVSAIAAFMIYLGMNFMFKTITISELKGYIAK